MKHGRICTICSKEYAYCPNCNSYAGMPSWKFLFCSENCKDIFETISEYEQNQIDTKTAKQKLDRLDLKSAEPLKAGAKEAIEKINQKVAEETPIKPRQKTVFIDPQEEQKALDVYVEPEVKHEQKFRKRNKKRSLVDSDMQTGSLS